MPKAILPPHSTFYPRLLAFTRGLRLPLVHLSRIPGLTESPWQDNLLHLTATRGDIRLRTVVDVQAGKLMLLLETERGGETYELRVDLDLVHRQITHNLLGPIAGNPFAEVSDRVHIRRAKPARAVRIVVSWLLAQPETATTT